MKQENDFLTFVNKLKILFRNQNQDIVFLCIGTDKVVGDSIGPITGSLLKRKMNNVYGDINENITFNNIESKLSEIELKYENPYIVSIDSALGSKEHLGRIYIESNGILIGKSLEKNINRIGDIGIKAVVGNDYKNKNHNFKVLQNVPVKDVVYMSKLISDGIYLAMYKD